MEKQDSFRGHGIDQNFATKFKSSEFYKEIYLTLIPQHILLEINLKY